MVKRNTGGGRGGARRPRIAGQNNADGDGFTLEAWRFRAVEIATGVLWRRAIKFRISLNGDLPEDLVYFVAVRGLDRAISTFDPMKGTSFDYWLERMIVSEAWKEANSSGTGGHRQVVLDEDLPESVEHAALDPENSQRTREFLGRVEIVTREDLGDAERQAFEVVKEFYPNNHLARAAEKLGWDHGETARAWARACYQFKAGWRRRGWGPDEATP